MAIVNNSNDLAARLAGVATKTSGTPVAAREPRPQAKVWLNIGYYAAEDKFIQLPVNIPIDTAEPVSVKGSDDWRKQQMARNALLEALQQMGLNLEPGTETEVHNLVIQIRRVKEDAPIDADDNEYIPTDFTSLLSIKR